jgi:type I restriction enzyme S subunit
MPLIDIRPTEWPIVKFILQTHVPGFEVWAFGSRATWKANQYSDLDLALVSEKQIPLNTLSNIQEDFDDSALPFKVDIIDLSTTSEKFRTIIERDRVVIQKNDKIISSAKDTAFDWRHCTIGDLCAEKSVELQTGPFGTQLHASDYADDGISVVPTEAIRARQINHAVLPKIRLQKANELSRHRIAEGDILFARRGVQAAGHIGYVRKEESGFICGTGAIRLRVINDKVSSEFLSHVLANPKSVEWFKFHAIGATMPNLNEGIIRSFPLSLPPLDQQKSIAKILSALDDKIELNRRMNETLEAMARALFKSWFVDFDPVRAKAEGRDTGLPPDLAALFPDSFEDSELGEIPKGWEVSKLGDVFELSYGRALKAEDRRPGPIPVYGSSGLIGWHNEKLAKGPGIIVGRKGNPGVVTWAPTDFYAIDTTFFVEPKGRIKSNHFFFYALQGQNLAGLGADSAVPGLNRNLAYLSKQIIPTCPVVDAFDTIANTIFAKIYIFEEETQKLADIRDALLPQLISGEIRVNSAETHREYGT